MRAQVCKDGADAGLERCGLSEGCQVSTCIKRLLPISRALLLRRSHPGHVEQLGDRGALVCIFAKRCFDELYGILRYVRLCKQIVVRLVSDNVVVDVLLATTPSLLPIIEGRHAGKQDEGDDSNGPNIDLVIVLYLLAELRRHVKWTAER